MSRPYNGRPPGEPDLVPGSIKRARERALMGMQREMQALGSASRTQLPSRPNNSSPFPPQSAPAGDYTRSPRSRVPGPIDSRSKGNKAISRPTQMAQWPLPAAASSSSPATDFPSNQLFSPAGQGPPQRPPRPSQSRIPSMLDQSRPQQPTPVFTSRSRAMDSTTNASQSKPAPSYEEDEKRRSTSTLGSIPDYPIAQQATHAKKTTMGPPPSSRRGASSFYSHRSYVSPIQEESPKSRSYRSFASSAAMPETWARGAPPYNREDLHDTYYEESIAGKTSDEYGDESQLVRSTSLGERAKAALIISKPATNVASDARPDQTSGKNADLRPPPTAVGFETSQDDEQGDAVSAVSSEDILKAYSAASAPKPQQTSQTPDTNRKSFRTSTLRRPPRLDIDAVRAAEARGSLTSLPDLILRATRLAAMMDKGRRPTSRLDTLDEYLGEKESAMGSDKEARDDARVSGLSGMLSAFPPPVPNSPRNYRRSLLRNSTWPGRREQGRPPSSMSFSEQNNTERPRRRCCGMPIWLFILVTIILLCLIVAAIVIPLEFFVFKNIGNQNKGRDNSAATQCKGILNCMNGGSSIIVQGNCSCVCVNGFTGADCTFSDSLGCTSTSLVSTDKATRISNATFGKAIPRLVAEASSNFSIPLSGAEVVAAFNKGNMSCLAQNALVTFNGRSTSGGAAAFESDNAVDANGVTDAKEAFPVITIITFTPVTVTTTITIPNYNYPQLPPAATALPPPSTTKVSNSPGTTIIEASTMPTQGATTSIRTTDMPTQEPSFTVKDDALDFARVSMLFILQQKGLDSASTAQQELQQFFTRATQSGTKTGKPVTLTEASKVDLKGGNTINLVDLTIDVGNGPMGSKGNDKRGVFSGFEMAEMPYLRRRTVHRPAFYT